MCLLMKNALKRSELLKYTHETNWILILLQRAVMNREKKPETSDKLVPAINVDRIKSIDPPKIVKYPNYLTAETHMVIISGLIGLYRDRKKESSNWS